MDIEAALREHVDEAASNGDIVVSVVAEKFVARQREENPQGFFGWLDEHADAFVHDRVRGMLNSRRSRARAQAERGIFADQARRFEAGEIDDEEFVTSFDVPYVIDNDNTRRKAGAMRGPDHEFVAAAYDCSGKRALLLAAFHRAVAHRCNEQRTDEVFSEESYNELLRSITGDNTD